MESPLMFQTADLDPNIDILGGRANPDEDSDFLWSINLFIFAMKREIKVGP